MDLTGELTKFWNMRETVMLSIVGALGTIPTGLEKRMEELEISGRIETIETTELLRSTKIFRRVLET